MISPLFRSNLYSSIFPNSGNQSLVREVAQSLFFECSSICVMTAATCYFTVSSFVPLFVATAIHHTSINILFRISQTCLIKLNNSRQLHNPIKKILELIIVSFEMIAALRFGYFYKKTVNVVIHEMGHALAALTVFKNAHPQVIILHPGHGSTKISNAKLNKFGLLLGEKKAKALFYIGGPFLGIIAASGLLIVAYKKKKQLPKFSLYLTSMSIQSIYDHFIHALKSDRDFKQIQTLIGLPPLIGAIFCIAIPVLLSNFFRKPEH